MSKVIALIYADKKIPAEIYAEAQRLQSQGRIDLIDVTEITVKDNGKIKFEQGMTLPLIGCSSGLFLPAFVGLIFFHPHYMANDNVQKMLQDISLDQNFIRVLSREVLPRNSVLFLYLRNQNTSQIAAAMTRHGGRVAEISLMAGQEEKLHRLFRGKPLPDPQHTMNI
ncbi:MAG TPA: DUF1269 domain-containing protein [Pseudobdellovibrionaceae bacterium]|jgi:uncharacterized membrane protein